MPNQYDPRLSEDTVQGILRDRDTGMTLHAIATRYGCSVSMAWKITNGVTRRQPDRDTGADMSKEELDAMVALQMKRLPKWWFKEYQQDRGGPRLPQAVLRGLGIQSRGERRKAAG